jgi:enterochelin esterase family protein
MAAKKPLVSPRIIALEQELATRNTTALDAFWQEVTEQGTPLIESIEGDDRHKLVTFLWRDKGDTKNVVIVGGPAGWGDLVQNQLTRLLNTDLWYRTYQARADLRTTYRLSPNDPLTEITREDDWKTRTATFQFDPLNPHKFFFPRDEEDPDDEDLFVSVLELPEAPPQPWITSRTGVPKGQVEMHRLRSTILDNERRVWIYTPPGYIAAGEPCGLLLLFDGLAYINLVPTPTILDNLLSEGRIPPLIAILPDSLNQETRSRELPCHQPFVDFLISELLPWVHEHYHVTHDPAQSIVAGSSYGGLAAAFVGLRAPEIFGNVLSQSGSFWWDMDPEVNMEKEWLIRQYATTPHLPLRFYLEVGLLEKTTRLNMVLNNRHLRDVLEAKDYEVDYTEYNGGHDYLCWRGSLADGLIELIGKKQKKAWGSLVGRSMS